MAKDKKLLFSITKKDLNITYFSGSGAGGQHRNRHMNCVRINHKDSHVTVTGQSHKERKQNIKEALYNLIKHPRFKMWHAITVNELIRGKTIDELVEEEMDEKNLIIETVDKDGKWVRDG